MFVSQENGVGLKRPKPPSECPSVTWEYVQNFRDISVPNRTEHYVFLAFPRLGFSVRIFRGIWLNAFRGRIVCPGLI